MKVVFALILEDLDISQTFLSVKGKFYIIIKNYVSIMSSQTVYCY